jgi:hypothetical protein
MNHSKHGIRIQADLEMLNSLRFCRHWTDPQIQVQGYLNAVLRIHMFLGLLDPDPDPLVRGIVRSDRAFFLGRW